MAPSGITSAELQFSSFLTQLKAAPASEDPMRPEQWSSPTSIASNPTDTTSSTSQPLPSFTLDQQSNYYATENLPPRQLSMPTNFYTQHQQQLLPPRDLQPTSVSTQWGAPNYTTAPMQYVPHHQPQPALHPLILQHSEPIPRSHDDDLVMDAQMLREVLQEMPSGQTPVAQPRAPQMPGLQLLFASPMHATDMPHAPNYFSNSMGMTPASADMLLTMSQAAATPVAPIFPPLQDRPLPTANLAVAFDPLVAPVLPRKKRTTATRICKIEGCTKGIRSRGLCKAHGGGRRCTTPGCTTSDQGGGHCVLHGGGRRCRIEGCKKSAQWRGVCKMHGGARRCRYGNCTKNGQVKQGYCRMHHNLLSAQRQQQEQLQQQQMQQMQQVQLPPMPVKLEADTI